MAQEIRLWEINEGDQLSEVSISKLNFEDRIESWLENDISIISDELMVIGRQVKTSYGGKIDILCIDINGDVVIIELKRDKTPRDITAQVLDYGSWVEILTHEQVAEIADTYFCGKTSIDEAYKIKFGEDYPEVINESHKMLIVGSVIDNSTERIVKYLSDKHGVSINAVTFNYYKNESGKEYLSRVFLIDPIETDFNVIRTTKRSRALTFEQFGELAEKNGVGDIYNKALEKLRPHFYTVTRHSNAIAFKGIFGEQRLKHSVIVIYPDHNDAENGLRMNIYIDRLIDFLSLDKDMLKNHLPLPEQTYEDEWRGEVGKYDIDSVLSIEKFLIFLEGSNSP